MFYYLWPGAFLNNIMYALFTNYIHCSTQEPCPLGHLSYRKAKLLKIGVDLSDSCSANASGGRSTVITLLSYLIFSMIDCLLLATRYTSNFMHLAINTLPFAMYVTRIVDRFIMYSHDHWYETSESVTPWPPADNSAPDIGKSVSLRYSLLKN